MRVTEEFLDVAHEHLAAVLGPGDVAVDATMGNGHDTRFLAEKVGPGGHVVAFDVQELALRQTRRRLEEAGLADRVTLLNAGHETMTDALPAVLGTDAPLVNAVCFNLGYLPGSDKSTITRPETTVRALNAALDLLAPDGVVTVVLYSMHEGGEEERAAVLDWARGLAHDRYHAVHRRYLNRPGASELLVIEPRA